MSGDRWDDKALEMSDMTSTWTEIATKDLAAALRDAYEAGRKDGRVPTGMECDQCCAGPCTCPCHDPSNGRTCYNERPG